MRGRGGPQRGARYASSTVPWDNHGKIRVGVARRFRRSNERGVKFDGINGDAAAKKILVISRGRAI